MPHIHTQPGQHDMVVSAFIVRRDAGEWKCLVHMHKKIDMLMQIGGHIELHETPWQSLAQEISDESGYHVSQLQVLQHTSETPNIGQSILHPTPFLVNTHNVGNNHFHSDLCYGFVASDIPMKAITHGESQDLRWHTITELRKLFDEKIAPEDTVNIYDFLLHQYTSFAKVPASKYSLDKPSAGISYKR